MPRFPEISSPAESVPSSIFQRVMKQVAGHRGPVYPFHLGDTHLLPPEEARLASLAWDDQKLYPYAVPAGEPNVLEAVCDKLARKNRLDVTPPRIQITAGATHALTCAVRAVLDKGDEVLMLAPYWPIIRGQILAVGARPVEVPFSSRLLADPALDPASILEQYITPRTAAIYFITPNNPDGKVFGRRELDAIAVCAQANGLWVLADEVYEDFTFDGREHVSIASLHDMDERTITAFSFSKSYAMSGLRIGYAVAPERVMVPIRKLANHSIYNVPRAMQRAAVAALSSGDSFLQRARAEYQGARDLTISKLTVPHHVPEGGSFVFMDLSRHCRDGETAIDVLERLASGGVLLAPGDAFGRDYAAWARLCYTAVPLETLEAGLVRMAALLASA